MTTMNQVQMNILKSRDSMNYRDPHFNQKPKVFDFSPDCPVCKRRLYYPGHMHVWMIVRRSDVLDVIGNLERPILMHKDCAARYEVTKRLMISAEHIPEDKVNIWDSVAANLFNNAKKDFTSQLLGSFPATAHDDRLDALAFSMFGLNRAKSEDDETLRSRMLQTLKPRTSMSIINEEMKS